MKTTLRSKWQSQFAIALAVAVLCIVVAIAYRGMATSKESERLVRHTHEVLACLQSLMFAMEQSQSSFNGFILTGEAAHLETYQTSRAHIQALSENVRRLVADNPTQLRRLPLLEVLIGQHSDLIDTAVDLRRTQGLAAAADFVRGGRSQLLMNQFQAVVDTLQNEELRLLAVREIDAKRHLQQTNAILIIGTALGLLVVAGRGWSAHREIGLRKEEDEHLAQMESRYRGLLEAAPDAMVVVNADGEIVLLNVQAEKRFGYRRDELLGQQVKRIIPEGFAERLIADGTRTAAAALAQQIGTGIELSGRRKDGSEFPIEIMLSPLESAEGILVTAAIRDISIRKAVELHLARMEGRYRGLLEAAPDAMVVVNSRSEIVLLNVQAEKQFGYHRDELVGQTVTNIIPEGFAERLITDARRSAEDALAQQIGTGVELSGRRKDGSEFPIEIMLSPLDSSEGILVTAAIRDISVRKEAEAHLLLKVEELNRSNEELGQFAYIASHDLQEPLRMVASYTQLLSRRYKGKLDADADEFIGFAVDGASHMQRLIHGLLAYSRVRTKGQELLDTSAEQALRQALLNLRSAIEDSGAIVTHDRLPAVLADETQLVQLFQNLIGNGIKYQNGSVPRVHISAVRNSAEQWLFAVRDNGLGIDAQYFERIFGMFQRLHKREEFAGTGIGLAICKKIVERHGSSISVQSQVGLGSTFSFALTDSAGS